MDNKNLSYIDFYNHKHIYLGIGYRTPADILYKFLNVVYCEKS